MQRTFKKVDVNFLKNEIENAAKKHGKRGKYLESVIIDLTKRIEKDLSKVSFDCENLNCEQSVRGSYDYSFLGYHTLDNGFTFLGVNAGGDWEYPVYFIIYWDGKKLRAYIPEDGNLWNTETKEAYGNDDDKDLTNAVKRFGNQSGYRESFEEFVLSYDVNKMFDEIKKRIIFKNES